MYAASVDGLPPPGMLLNRIELHPEFKELGAKMSELRLRVVARNVANLEVVSGGLFSEATKDNILSGTTTAPYPVEDMDRRSWAGGEGSAVTPERLFSGIEALEEWLTVHHGFPPDSDLAGLRRTHDVIRSKLCSQAKFMYRTLSPTGALQMLRQIHSTLRQMMGQATAYWRTNRWEGGKLLPSADPSQEWVSRILNDTALLDPVVIVDTVQGQGGGAKEQPQGRALEEETSLAQHQRKQGGARDPPDAEWMATRLCHSWAKSGTCDFQGRNGRQCGFQHPPKPTGQYPAAGRTAAGTSQPAGQPGTEAAQQAAAASPSLPPSGSD